MQRFWSIVLVISGIAAIGFAAFGAFAAPNTAGTAALCFGLPGFLMILMGRRAHQRADFAREICGLPTARLKSGVPHAGWNTGGSS